MLVTTFIITDMELPRFNMNNPELYNEQNDLARYTIRICLDEYIEKIKWTKSGDTIIDLGCGDGSVTHILKGYLPKNYEKFVACDINENMLRFAKKHYGENITFRIQDVEGDLAGDLKGSFNHVFSFFLFHWIRKQETGFNNIYNLLSKGGDCFLTFFSDMPIYDIYNILGHGSKWGTTWLRNVEDTFLSPYYGMKDPEQKVRQILSNIGFADINVQCKKMSYVFNNIVDLKRLIRAVEPYDMPDEVYEDFFVDFLAVGKDIGFLDKSINSVEDVEKEIIYNYTIIIVHAYKPQKEK